MSRWAWILATLAAGIVTPLLSGPAAAGRAIALVVLPGLAILALVAPAALRRPATGISAIILCSAVAAPASLFLLARFTGGIDGALPPFGLFWGLAGALALWRRRTAERHFAPVAGTSVSSGPLAELGSILAVSLLLGLPLLLNGALRTCSDAWTHIAIVRTQLSDPYPWTDPRFVGQPLRYFWFFNYWAAAFAARDGLSIPWSLTMTNLAGLVAFVAAAFAMGRNLLGEERRLPASFGVLLLGLAPFGWMGILARLGTGLIGEHRGAEALRAAWSGLHLMDRDVLYTLTPPFCSTVHWHGKFLVITAFGLALAAATLIPAVLWEAGRRRRLDAATWVVVAVSFTALLFHHLVAAAFVACTTAASIGIPRLFGRGPFSWRATLAAALAFLVPLIAAAPYCRDILAGRDVTAGPDGYGVGVEGLWFATAALALGPLLALLWYGRGDLRKVLGGAQSLFVVSLIASFSLILFFRMPSVNENKLQLITYCVIAPFAIVGVQRWRRLAEGHPARRRLGRWVVALAAPVPLLFLFGYLFHRAPALAPGVEAAARWLRQESPVDAVLIEPVTSQLLLNLAERELLVSKPTFIVECGYPRAAMQQRLDLVSAIYAGGTISEPQRKILTALHRPVYLFWTSAEGSAVQPDSAEFRLVFRSGATELYLVSGTSGD